MCVLVSAASQLLSCLLSFGVSFHSNTQRELFRIIRLSILMRANVYGSAVRGAVMQTIDNRALIRVI